MPRLGLYDEQSTGRLSRRLILIWPLGIWLELPHAMLWTLTNQTILFIIKYNHTYQTKLNILNIKFYG
jgi:hypothetical protein